MFTIQKLPTILEITEESLDKDNTFIQDLTALDDEEISMFTSLNISGNESPRFDSAEKMFATASSHSILTPVQVINNFEPKISREPTPMPELATPSPLTASNTPSPEFFIPERVSTEDQLQSNLEFKEDLQKPERFLFLSVPFNQGLRPFHFSSNGLEEGKEEALEKKYKAISYYPPIVEQEGGLSYEAIKRVKIK